MILQNASAQISVSGTYGTWAFLPVTDGTFIQQRPSEQLLKKQVNGVRILSGNNADEGALFVSPTIKTEKDFIGFLRNMFPLFQDNDISRVLRYYPSNSASHGGRFATLGDVGPTALDVSPYAFGQQQRANVSGMGSKSNSISLLTLRLLIHSLNTRTCMLKSLSTVLPTGLQRPSRTSLEQLININSPSQSPTTPPM